jgi:hypothetical protein
MEPDGLQSWSPMCERVNCNKREAVSLPDATIGIRKLCNPNGTALLGNYSDSLQAFKCPCTRTWLGCAICEWTSPANGIRFRPSNPLVKSYLVLHFLSPGHENKVMESNARPPLQPHLLPMAIVETPFLKIMVTLFPKAMLHDHFRQVLCLRLRMCTAMSPKQKLLSQL